jgi:hypothetical protein
LRYLHFTNWTNLSDANVGQRIGTGWKVSNCWQRKFERHQGLVSALRDDGAVDLMAFMKVAKEIEPIGGVFHHAKMDLLKCSGGDYATMAARAREYWTEIAADDDPSGEVLFFGDSTITRITRPRAATE